MGKRFRVLKKEMNKENTYNITSISRLANEIDKKGKMKDGYSRQTSSIDNTDSAKYFVEYAIMINLNVIEDDLIHINNDLSVITYFSDELLLIVDSQGNIKKRYIDKIEYNLHMYNYTYEEENGTVAEKSHSKIVIILNSSETYQFEYSNTFRGMDFECFVESIIKKY